MFVDARTLPSGTRVECDVCIVGAGAAGIAIARRLGRARLDVCLLESGGLAPDPATQDLSVGRGVGLHPDEYVSGSRQRFLGGSTNHWAGACAPLDAEDFAVRAWVPDSGWPLERESLAPYYEEAQRLCQLGPYRYEPAAWLPEDEAEPFSAPAIRMRLWQLSPPTRFGIRFRGELERDPRVAVHLNATAVNLEPDEGSNRIVRVDAATLSGVRFSIVARGVVLAAGGIENPRLLLLSTSRSERGLGNAHDQVGRWFMDHPHLHFDASPAVAIFSRRELYACTSLIEREGVRLRPGFQLHPVVQRRERLLNTIFTLRQIPVPPYPLSSGVGALLRAMADAAPHDLGDKNTFVYSKAEQVPNPDSRVTLGSETDALGQRRAVLDWRLTEQDRDSLQRSLRYLAAELGRTNDGRLRMSDWLTGDEVDWRAVKLRGGGHLMGTTRMSEDPRGGVVDPDGRVHGLANLWVAGSSVFPTVGWANPTLTLLALAVRLSDHVAAHTERPG